MNATAKMEAQAAREAELDAALAKLCDAVPYNRFIGVGFDRLGDELTARMPRIGERKPPDASV